MNDNMREFLNALVGGLCLFGIIVLLYLVLWLGGC